MKKIIAAVLVMAPSVAFAQNQVTNFGQLVAVFTNIGTTLISVLIALGVIWIIYNIVRFIMAADKPEERNTRGKAILWGIVGLFVILSIWGLVAILSNTFGIQNHAPVGQFPAINTFVQP